MANDIVIGLRWVAEQGQCDCHICDTAVKAADEIERLRALLLAVHVKARGAWQEAHHG